MMEKSSRNTPYMKRIYAPKTLKIQNAGGESTFPAFSDTNH